jgi:DNA-binding XRE family transcriptional regulator
MPRAKPVPTQPGEAKTVGGLLRNLRRAAGYRSVQLAAAADGCPAARQTIYSYERGGQVPSLKQFLDLVEFYAAGSSAPAKPPEDLRSQAVAAIAQALTLPAFHVAEAAELMARLQPSFDGGPSKRRSPGRARKQGSR